MRFEFLSTTEESAVVRAAELTALESRVDAVRTGGRCAAVAVAGDPGMGKSTLLARLASAAHRDGFLVLAGRVGELERTLPYGVFVSALDDHLAGREDLWSPTLGSCFPAVPGNGEPVGRHVLHREVRALLTRLAGTGLLLVLDDLHWADEASLHLLTSLLHDKPAAPVLIACGYRPRQLTTELDVEVVELGPVALDDAARIVGRAPRQCAEMYELSGGNPLYLAALADDGTSLGAVLRGELSGLSDDATRVLQVAAVLSDPFEPAVVAEITGLGVDEVYGFLDELSAADLVRGGEDLRSYRFRHPTVRTVAYRSAPASVRHRAHRCAATVLERRGASAGSRAMHVEFAAQPGDHQAVAVLTAAADDALHRAPETAAHWYGKALELDPDAGLDLRWGRARALGLAGRLRESRDALHSLLDQQPAGHPDRPAVVAFCAHVERSLGRHAEVRALAQRELAAMPDHGSPHAAVLKLVVALSLSQALESPLAVTAHLDSARTLARRLADPVLEAGAHAVEALVAGKDSADLREAALAIDNATDEAVAERIESVVWLGWSELRVGRYRDSLRHYERALAVAGVTGQHHMLGNLLLGRANAVRWLGGLEEAERGAEEAVEVAYLSGSADLHALTLAVHSWVLILRGDHVRGMEVARRAADVARTLKGWHHTLARLRIGHARLAAGQHEAALFDLRAAGGGPELPAVPQAYRPEFAELLVQCCPQDVAEAERWATEASAGAGRLRLPGCAAFAHLAWAQVHLARREFDSAAERAGEAIALFGRTEQRLEAARAHLVRAKALTALRADAEPDHRRARALFTACGVQSPEQVSTTAADVLTRRERDVAALVADGMTNRQVARRLEMSEKTVEGHLSKIFAKRSVQSRSGLVKVFTRPT
ncbi:ATP-binding protein [Lentzea sp. JNUCC 0626]|uniref:ATP-binding protein n=1 Tax=Lentzea sp. JNUCC 0626 TaxID=3367513 RepID=UPI00374A503D